MQRHFEAVKPYRRVSWEIPKDRRRENNWGRGRGGKRSSGVHAKPRKSIQNAQTLVPNRRLTESTGGRKTRVWSAGEGGKNLSGASKSLRRTPPTQNREKKKDDPETPNQKKQLPPHSKRCNQNDDLSTRVTTRQTADGNGKTPDVGSIEKGKSKKCNHQKWQRGRELGWRALVG